MLVRLAFLLSYILYFWFVYIVHHRNQLTHTHLIDSPPCGRGVSVWSREGKSTSRFRWQVAMDKRYVSISQFHSAGGVCLFYTYCRRVLVVPPHPTVSAVKIVYDYTTPMSGGALSYGVNVLRTRFHHNYIYLSSIDIH
jgi:hypothetical protein|uniref:Uncharacterized protein n=1 Tax=Halorubrum lacusprofundi TaxID=2247 RepID=A0A218KRZ3_9EURY|nr:hypothetical protein [Halorubrum lacusprofundi]